MPPTAAYLEDWWLDSGYEALSKLVDHSDMGLSAHNVGFAQAAQRKLRAFDNDRDLHGRLRLDWHAALESRGVDFDVNPRKRLKVAANEIFKPSENGCINYAEALEGLGHLDAAEIHRLRLLAATRLAMETSPTGEQQSQVVDFLHRTASKRYRQFHMGFRACVSTSTASHCF
jgi:hypothetical protein